MQCSRSYSGNTEEGGAGTGAPGGQSLLEASPQLSRPEPLAVVRNKDSWTVPRQTAGCPDPDPDPAAARPAHWTGSQQRLSAGPASPTEEADHGEGAAEPPRGQPPPPRSETLAVATPVANQMGAQRPAATSLIPTATQPVYLSVERGSPASGPSLPTSPACHCPGSCPLGPSWLGRCPRC